GMTLSVLGDSSIFNMIAGGNTTLRLGACSHLFGSGIESTAICTNQSLLTDYANPTFSSSAP
ncbi:MAG: hypothetical protein ACXWJK_14535, partial [Burkholderiaceae bacterium]